MAGLFDEQQGGLVAYWKTVSAITSRVGSGSAAKIASDVASEKWRGQFIVYTRGAGGTVHRHLTGTTGVRMSLVHVYAWGDTRSEADALIEAIKQAMQTGFARNTWVGVYVNQCHIDEPQDDGYDKPTDSSAASKFWSRLVLRITHTESGGT